MAIFDNLFGAPPEYLTGLLGADETDKLRKQALTTGLVNSAIALIAQPRNQRYGSALPYIGKALMAGQQAGQGVYSNALQGLETQQKLAEFKRKQEQQQKMQEMLGNITDPNERLFAQLAPEQYVTGKLKPVQPKERKTATVGNVIVDVETGQPIYTGESKENIPTSAQEYQLAQKDPNFAKFLQERKPAGVNVSYGAPMAGVDAQGNPVFFQPSKGGGAPAVIPGVTPPPREEKAPTESQAKATAFGSQMQSASQEFDQIQKEGFAPGATTAQAQVELAATPLRMLADPLAQRAQQSQAQWSEAYLRYKTGAAATEGEVKRNINTFFPKIGETNPKVIEQKARMRKQAEQDVLKSAAPTGKQIMPKGEQMPTTRRKFNPATGRIE